MNARFEEPVDVTRRRFVQILSATPLLGFSSGLAQGATGARGAPDSLAGQWRLALDPVDKGLRSRWFDRRLEDVLSLPGNLEEHRIGQAVTVGTPWTGDLFDHSYFDAPAYGRYRDPSDIKVPFFLQPDTWYRGAAWYQRDISIPESWRGKRVELFLERVHWGTMAWIDGRSLGQCDALHVPHTYDFGVLTPGMHRLTIRVDNRMLLDIGRNGHGITDHTQGNWNGIAGRIELRASELVWIDRVDLYPQFAGRELQVRGRVLRAGTEGGPRIDTADILLAGKALKAPITWVGRQGSFEGIMSPEASDAEARRPWDEFSPVLHQVDVHLANGEAWHGRFGWRDLRATRTGFEINGRPAMFRGALECSIFPLTGHPPTTIGEWRHVMMRAKEYGLNHLRFHSYCPPQAAFDAADEVGLYMQIETVWGNWSTRMGGGLPVDAWVYAETERILATHGNHPSFMLMTHGNEPGDDKTPEHTVQRDVFLAAYVRHYRALDSRRLWTSGSGWPTIEDNQYHVTPVPRIQQWGEELTSRINAKPPETVSDYREFIGQHAAPVISHEIGQWCVYPNLEERRKYTGHLKARNFDIFEDRLRENGLLGLAPAFVHASGRLQVLCYKEDIESALRTNGMGGFQLLGLQDFPGQGTAMVGVVDAFWDDKGYVSSREYRRFCAPVVPLARLASRIARSGDPLSFTIDVANFGPAALDATTVAWRVEDLRGHVLAQGDFGPRVIPLGNAPLDLTGRVILSVEKATQAQLIVTLKQDEGFVAENDWDIWIHPMEAPKVDRNARLRVAERIDQGVLDHVMQGGDALIGLPAPLVANYRDSPVKAGFSSIFWNTSWTGRQAPTTLGIYCDPAHPALHDFPTQAHSNWQWWFLMHRAGALRLDLLPPGTVPIVRVIDDWFTARPLGLVVELTVGKGRVVMCGFAVEGPDAQDPVSRQLIASLTRYMASGSFRPTTQASPDQLRALSAI